MLKKIIFDLDNTLIPWLDKYNIAAEHALDDFHIEIEDRSLSLLQRGYQKELEYLTLENMTEYFNLLYKQNVSIDFTKRWLKYLGLQSSVDDRLIDMLKYLSSKYELVILTNWFYSSQYERLKNAKIDMYFKEIISGEEIMKPSKEAFLKAVGSASAKDCLMVGDNYDIDIIPAKKLGIDVLLVSKYQKYPVKTIKNIYELRKML